jgi:hypothetical protein
LGSIFVYQPQTSAPLFLPGFSASVVYFLDAPIEPLKKMAYMLEKNKLFSSGEVRPGEFMEASAAQPDLESSLPPGKKGDTPERDVTEFF